MADKHPILEPVTDAARESVDGNTIHVRDLPFRVGRESRFAVVNGALQSIERLQTDIPPNNELYLHDNEEALNVSREHFQIERADGDSYCVRDRNSTCGTIVDDTPIGGEHRSFTAPLRDGSIIIVGTTSSPYRFRFVIHPRSN